MCVYVNCDVLSSELYRFVIYFEILPWNILGRNGENYGKAQSRQPIFEIKISQKRSKVSYHSDTNLESLVLQLYRYYGFAFHRQTGIELKFYEYAILVFLPQSQRKYRRSMYVILDRFSRNVVSSSCNWSPPQQHSLQARSLCCCENSCSFPNVCPSVCPHVKTRLPPDGYLCNCLFVIFTKTFQCIPILVKIGQSLRAFYSQTYVQYVHENISP